MGGAELVNRVLRLGLVVVLARMLTPYDYGLAAIVLTVNEFTTVFSLKAGITYKLIQADEAEIAELSETAYWLSWILCGFFFIAQCLLSFPIAWFYNDTALVLPICVMAVTYLILPTFSIQEALIQRENRLNILALCNITQSFIGSTLTVIFALMGFGMWAIVLPMLLILPAWYFITLSNHPWRPHRTFSLHRWRELARFAFDILGVELLTKLRANLDYLLVGRFLGLEALGFYFFAFNAGLGISLNIITALTRSLYPHLCEVQTHLQQLSERYSHGLRTIAKIIIPFVLLQSGLAPFYVPLVHGEKWIAAIPILILICLSAIPRPFSEAASMLLQAVDKTRISLYWNLGFTIIFSLALVVVVPFGIFWVAMTVLISHFLILPIFTVWTNQYVFKRIKFSEVN
ncbi:MAG: MOP flippase family protein [Elainellaceae cyanobacterium]